MGELLQPYTLFAELYDELMVHVPYDEWASYLVRTYRRFRGSDPPVIYDLACGTGRLLEEVLFLCRKEPQWANPSRHPARIVQLRGFDISRDMIQKGLAREKGITLSPGDMRYGMGIPDKSADWVIVSHDSLNYLISETDLQSHLDTVARILKKDGIYSLDLVSEYNILHNYANRTLFRELPGWRIIWQNRYDQTTREIETRLTFENLESRQSYQELHLEKCYEVDYIVALALRSGLVLLARESDYESGYRRQAMNLWNLHFRKAG